MPFIPLTTIKRQKLKVENRCAFLFVSSAKHGIMSLSSSSAAAASSSSSSSTFALSLFGFRSITFEGMHHFHSNFTEG